MSSPAETASLGGPAIERVAYAVTLRGAPDLDWRVRRFWHTEAISQPYELELDLVAGILEQFADTDELLGADVGIEIQRGPLVRAVSGIVHRVYDVGVEDGEHQVLRMTVVPAWHYLEQHVDCRIFQDMTVPEILEAVLGEALGLYGRSVDVSKLGDSYITRDYCVQYSESVFDFASRLMEEEGISYVFRPESDDADAVEQMVLIDHIEGSPNASFEDIEGLFEEEVQVRSHEPDIAPEETVQALAWSIEEQVNQVVLRRFNWKRPLASPSMEAEASVDAVRSRRRSLYVPDDRRRVTDRRDDDAYSGTEVHEDEDMSVRRRYEKKLANSGRGRGASNLIGMIPGGTFTLGDHVDPIASGQRLLVTRVVHTGEADDFDGGDAARVTYSNTFECIRAETPFRPTLSTPRPRVHGPQTAFVTGPEGQEIHTDQHGRIQVRFHWDRSPANAGDTSCWIRVAQTWAGPSWGAWFLPRVGMEVLVEFLDGNPDRPLVTGCVYNGANAPPYPLPDNKTISTIKTNSSPGGTGFNELRFEDAKGSEEIFMHAQRNLAEVVLADRSAEVGNDDREVVGNDKSIDVQGFHQEGIGKDMTLQVGANHSASIGGDHQQTVSGSSSESVSGTADLTIDGAATTTMGADYTESVGSNKSVSVGGDFETRCDGAVRQFVELSTTLTSGKDATIKTSKSMLLEAEDHISHTAHKKINVVAGDNLNMKTDKKAFIAAAEELTLQVGDAQIVLKSNGDISINGATITIDGSGAVSVRGSTVDHN
ncbi:MAG: type VI secretion system tip protein TssI/VgrG [Myxococcota bacterium]